MKKYIVEINNDALLSPAPLDRSLAFISEYLEKLPDGTWVKVVTKNDEEKKCESLIEKIITKINNCEEFSDLTYVDGMIDLFSSLDSCLGIDTKQVNMLIKLRDQRFKELLEGI